MNMILNKIYMAGKRVSLLQFLTWVVHCCMPIVSSKKVGKCLNVIVAH